MIKVPSLVYAPHFYPFLTLTKCLYCVLTFLPTVLSFPAGRMAKIAQLWKDLPDEEKTVWGIKAKSAWEAWSQAIANLPEDVRY